MAYCASCLDGPEDPAGIVLEWGDREGAGRVVSFNFNPLHRDRNRGDHRLRWNPILNWQAILAGSSSSEIGITS